jgi:signal transduction histidine kinase
LYINKIPPKKLIIIKYKPLTRNKYYILFLIALFSILLLNSASALENTDAKVASNHHSSVSFASEDPNVNKDVYNITKDLENKYNNSTDQKEKLSLLFEICEIYSKDASQEIYKYALEAYSIAQKLNDVDGQIKALKYLEYYNYLIGNYSESVQKLLDASNLATKYNFKRDQIEINIRLGDNYRALTNISNSISTLKGALSEAIKINDTFLIARAYNRLAATYFELIQVPTVKGRDTTIYYAMKSQDLARKINDTALIINNLNILGACYGEVLNDHNRKAINTLLEAFSLAKQFYDKESISVICYHLTKMYFLENNTDSAYYFANYGYQIAKAANIKSVLSVLSLSLASYYEKIGRFDSAYKYHQEFHNYFEEVNNNKLGYKIKTILQENQKKQDDLKEEMQARSRMLRTIIFVMSIILLAFISVVLFLRHKHSEQSRALLQTQLKIIELQNSELEKKNQIIIEQNNELKRSNSDKDKLFSIISHDLKNPIGNLNSSLSLLIHNWEILDDNEKRELISELEKSNQNVLILLYDLLDWAKSQQGKITMQPSNQDINFIIKQNIEFVQKIAQEKGIHIDADLQNDAVGYYDTAMINTVIRNLITNAIKFTNRGGKITIKSKTDNNKLIVSVADTGVGITEDNLRKLFSEDEIFSTVGTGGEKGTGFGLILIKEFIDKNNGQLQVESQLGIGTKFTFQLPTEEINE